MSLSDYWENQPGRLEHQDLKGMYRTIIESVTSSEPEILQFLEYSSQLYKYEMDSLLFAYGQNPMATYLADFQTWKNVQRSVKRGSKAIKVLHQSENGRFYHSNLFDVSQTVGREINFPNWLMDKNEYQKVVNNAFPTNESQDDPLWQGIQENYALEDLATDHASDFPFYGELSEFMLQHKLGQSPRWKDYIECVEPLVNNPDLLVATLPRILKTNRNILSIIAATKNEFTKEQDYGQQSRQIGRVQSAAKTNQPGISKTNGTDTSNELSGEGRSDVSRSSEISTKSRSDSSRENNTTVSGGTETHLVSGTETNGAVDDLSQSKTTRDPNKGTDGIPETNGGDSTDSSEGSSTTNSKTESTEATDSRNGVTADSSNGIENPSKISFNQINAVLKVGSGVSGGKLRIQEYFSQETNTKKLVDFLKNEYGTGGMSNSGGTGLTIQFDGKGFRIGHRFTENENAIHLSWNQVADHIKLLVSSGKYLTADEKIAYHERLDEKQQEKTSEYNKMSTRMGDTKSLEQDSTLFDSAAWTELPDDFRYQEINGRSYLINEKGEYEKDPVNVLFENGKTYYQTIEKTEISKKTDHETSQEELTINLFDFSYSDPVGSERANVSRKEDIPTIDRIDFTFPEDTKGFYGSTPKEKLHDNLAALNLLKQLESEDRLANSEEQTVLAKYVGWGGLSVIFDDSKDSYREEREELRQLLTDGEYESARESVLTAYYTDPMVIREIYSTLERFHFSSGRILDPAMGSGNFFSAMPEEMRENSSLYGVEIDSLSARLSKQLHQTVHIEESGFENTKFLEGSFDVVVSNVPFADQRITDNKTLDRYYIHDYFIKHSLDLVHSGGIVAVITSSGTMDKKDSYFREELSSQADLLGAVRLPNNTFQEIAGTEVTTDILFFRKKDRAIAEELEQEDSKKPEWVETTEVPSGIRREDGSLQPPMTINTYYDRRPSSVLGSFAFKNFRGGTYTVAPKEGQALQPLLSNQLKQLNGYFISAATAKINLPDVLPDTQQSDLSIDVDAPPYTFIEHGGEIYLHEQGQLVQQELKGVKKKRMVGMIGLRDQVSQVISYQQQIDYDPEVFQEQLKKLNDTYDRFVQEYGYLNTPTNTRLFYQDDRSALLSSIETINKDGSYSKADIFEKPTIRPIESVKEVGTAIEALNHSLSKYGKINFDYMQRIYSIEIDKIIQELDAHIFVDVETYLNNEKDIFSSYVTKDAYLSGDVKQKLYLAQMMVSEESLFEKNIQALKEVIPKDLTVSEIDYDIGSSWLPLDMYHQFIKEVFDIPKPLIDDETVHVVYNRFSDHYHIEGKGYGNNSILLENEYGTERANGFVLLEKSLNLKTIQIFDQEVKYVNGERVTDSILNIKETMMARAKQEQLHHVFKDWLFKEPNRAEELLKIYNDRFNRIRPRLYDGSYLSFEGMNQDFELRPHQKNVVARIVENGRALMAHEVGAGKTASMISAGIMMKDQGLIQKPMYVVPNHLTEQFGQELLRFYPAKKVLVTTKKDFEKRNRHKFISKIATGDYDAVIIGHSQFEKIPLSKERKEAVIRKELNEVKEGISLEKSQSGQSWSLKQMVSFEKKLKERLKNLQNEDYKDQLLTFEELGVDFLFVDESHNYKNLYTYTKMSNVAGVNTSNSLRATDMYMKTQYLLEKHQGRGVVFATGTAISNSMSELYTLERYLQPDELARMNLTTFDRWASTFGEVVTAPEINPEGSGFRMKSRFAKFHNLPELMSSFSLVADIQTSDMLNLPVPEVQNGKPKLMVSEPSEYQELKMMELADRADEIRTNNVDPREDNMLKITNEAKLMSIDARLLEEQAPIHEGGKLFKCVENVYKIWNDYSETQSTQIVFSDSGTPKPGKFNVYDEMKRLLIEKGIPDEQIAFIHSAKTDLQRERLFDKVRQGEVRILFGSTEKLGTGTNIQDKLIADHHLDVPWRPSDITQRDGRIVRQGNENTEVQLYRYVARNSFDSYLWQTQENKLKFINQIMSGKSIARTADDIDQTALNAAEAKALATSNPLLLEKMNVDKEVMNLQLLKSSWQTNQIALNQRVETEYPKRLDELSALLNHVSEDNQLAAEQLSKEFSIVLNDRVYGDKKEALDVFNALLPSKFVDFTTTRLGEYCGFDITATQSQFGQVILTLKNQGAYEVAVERDGKGSFIRMSNVLKSLPDQLNDLRNEQADLTKKMEQATVQLQKSFDQDQELSELLKQQTAINLRIEMGDKSSSIDNKQSNMTGPTIEISSKTHVDEQSNAYLVEQQR
jgi:N12 class adenine-specific DNA methylase